MKKKLNLLWNLKFNFFSVAERPLTFFAYFLNAKKVGRRRLVIVPATAGGLPLFPHAASAFTPALAPVRSHFACGETGLAGHRPHRGRRFAVPVTAAPRRGPNGKTPAPFACFLNTKKVTPSADFGISPRFRGGLPFFPQAAFYSSAPRLFAPSGTASSHSRLAFSLHRSNTRPPPSQKRNRARARLH